MNKLMQIIGLGALLCVVVSKAEITKKMIDEQVLLPLIKIVKEDTQNKIDLLKRQIQYAEKQKSQISIDERELYNKTLSDARERLKQFEDYHQNPVVYIDKMFKSSNITNANEFFNSFHISFLPQHQKDFEAVSNKIINTQDDELMKMAFNRYMPIALGEEYYLKLYIADLAVSLADKLKSSASYKGEFSQKIKEYLSEMSKNPQEIEKRIPVQKISKSGTYFSITERQTPLFPTMETPMPLWASELWKTISNKWQQFKYALQKPAQPWIERFARPSEQAERAYERIEGLSPMRDYNIYKTSFQPYTQRAQQRMQRIKQEMPQIRTRTMEKFETPSRAEKFFGGYQ